MIKKLIRNIKYIRDLKLYQSYKEAIYDILQSQTTHHLFITFGEFRARINSRMSQFDIVLETLRNINEQATTEQLIEEYYN